MNEKIRISNKDNELLDLLIEGNNSAKVTVILVHGFATDKHETAGYFDDISDSLKDIFRIVRFDFSGCGNSQGKLEEKDYKKWSEDLQVVINYVKEKFGGTVYIIAQSMGCFVTSLLSPDDIKKIVFTGIPNDNTQYIIDHLFKRFGERAGGKIDMEGISLLPRSTGKVQKIGPTFWQVLKSFSPAESVSKLSSKTNLLIVHPKQDEVIGDVFLEAYGKIPNIKETWLDGNHAFSKTEDRKILMKEIKNFLL